LAEVREYARELNEGGVCVLGCGEPDSGEGGSVHPRVTRNETSRRVEMLPSRFSPFLAGCARRDADGARESQLDCLCALVVFDGVEGLYVLFDCHPDLSAAEGSFGLPVL
jgi:hypothetical protein